LTSAQTIRVEPPLIVSCERMDHLLAGWEEVSKDLSEK